MPIDRISQDQHNKTEQVSEKLRNRVVKNHEILEASRDNNQYQELSEAEIKALSQNLRIYEVLKARNLHQRPLVNPKYKNKLFKSKMNYFLDVEVPQISTLREDCGLGERLEDVPEFEQLLSPDAKDFDKNSKIVEESISPDKLILETLLESCPEDVRLQIVDFYVNSFFDDISTVSRRFYDQNKNPSSHLDALNSLVVASYKDVIKICLKSLIKTGHSEKVDYDSYRGFLNLYTLDVANDILLSEDLNLDQRKEFALNFIDTYGFMAFLKTFENSQKPPVELVNLFEEIANSSEKLNFRFNDNLFSDNSLTKLFSKTSGFDQRFEDVMERISPNLTTFNNLIEGSSEASAMKVIDIYLKTYQRDQEKLYEFLRWGEGNIRGIGYTEENINKSKTIFCEAYKEILRSALVYLSKKGNSEKISGIFKTIFSYGNIDVANEVMLSDDLSAEERRKFAIDYINNFGFITFTRLVENSSNPPTDLVEFFKEVNGVKEEKGFEFVRDVDQFYSKSEEDFLVNYDPKLSELEISRITKVLDSIGIKLEDASVLDLGAGYGRLSEALLRNGVRRLVSAEYVPGYISQMEAAREDFNIDIDRWGIYRADWKDLRALASKIEKPELGVCLGRSLPHVNCMEDLVQVFSQMTRENMPDTWIFDYPDTDTGYYAETSARYRELLSKMGIDYRSMNLVYDGIDNSRRMHRMFASQKQLKSVCELLGFEIEVEKAPERTSYSSNLVNNTYVIKRKPDFNIESLTKEDIYRIFSDLDLLKPGTNFNIMLPPPINLSLGQLLCYTYSQIDNPETEEDFYLIGVMRDKISEYRKNNDMGINSTTWQYSPYGLVIKDIDTVLVPYNLQENN